MIIRDGPLLNAVQVQVRELGLGDVVIFTGLQRNIPELLALLDAFVLSSNTRIVSARGARGDGGGQTRYRAAYRRVPGGRGGWHHGISLRAPECRGACGTHAGILGDGQCRVLGQAARSRVERLFSRRLWVDGDERVYLERFEN